MSPHIDCCCIYCLRNLYGVSQETLARLVLDDDTLEVHASLDARLSDYAIREALHAKMDTKEE
jgi:hypothetical protein